MSGTTSVWSRNAEGRRDAAPAWTRLLRRGALGATVGVVLLLLTSGVYAASLGGAAAPLAPQAPSAPTVAHAGSGSVTPTLPSASAGAGQAVTSSGNPSAGPAGANPHPLGGIPSSGRGIFFNNTVFPYIPTANQTCTGSIYYSACFNSTSEPSINLTTNGVLVVAYTAWTNMTDCPQFAGNGTTEIAVRTSTNLGASWNTPLLMDNPVCTGYDGNFSSSAQPSITSLSNGTMVMAWEEYNFTCTGCYFYEVAPYFYPYYNLYDRIVVSDSYDNGSTWTTPIVLSTVNESGGGYGVANYPSLMPRIAAGGDYVYVAWTNYTQSYPCGQEVGVKVSVSSDGGSTWSTPTAMPVNSGSSLCYPSNTFNAANPDIVVVPNGTVYMSYLTKLAYTCNYYCEPSGEVVVARSSNHGSTWVLATVMDGLVMQYDWCCDNSIFATANPSLTYAPTTNQLFVTWASSIMGNFCAMYTPTDNYCGTEITNTLYIGNSSDGGSNWNAHEINTSAVNPNGGPWNQYFNPSVGVTANGVVHLQSAFENDSVCGGIYNYCGAIQQIYMNSTDNGTTWSPQVLVFANFSESEPDVLHPGWPGEYTMMQPIGNTVLLAWTFQNCTSGFCDWAYGTPAKTGVVVSQLYTGEGLTVTFSESGLSSGVLWTASVMGNLREASAPGTVSVSGIPPGQYVAFSVPSVHQGWGVRYESALSVGSPSSFSSNTTVTVTFTENVLFTFDTLPGLGIDQACYGYANYLFSPCPSSMWLAVNSSMSLTLTQQPLPSYCYNCANLTFQSWTGSGIGNYSGLSPNITVTVGGPLNETANFILNGWCNYDYYYGVNVCFNNTYYPMNFVESGLPDNVSWGVTVIDTNGTVYQNSTTGDVNGFLVPGTPVDFYVWTVPDSSTGQFWIPSTDVQSPTDPAQSGLIHVTFTEEAASAATFPTIFMEQGLPSGSSWSLDLNSQSYGMQNTANYTTELTGGTGYTVNGSYVYLETGYGYYVSSITETSYVMNSSAQSLTPGGTLIVNGSAVVTLVYSPLYLLTTAASTGGTVLPATGWVVGGTSVVLNASPMANYHFVGWTGSGSGATTTAQASNLTPTITPRGPVTEFATFRPNPIPTWNVTIAATGLPPGTAVSISIGNTTYSGVGTYVVGEIVNGTYNISVPYVYLNATDTTRFVPTSISSDLTFASNGQLEVSANGTVTVAFTTQYLIQLSATPSAGGSITPAPGQYWTNASDSVSLVATPASGYYFVGWNASTSNGVVSNQMSVTLTALGPVVETAQFHLRPILPPATYWVRVTETGLPLGVDWNLSFGPFGASGSNSTLTIFGLNGSYVVNVPAIYVGTGVRYLSNVTNVSVQVLQNSTRLVSVSFVTQYLVSVSTSTGGNVTPTTSQWVNKGGSLSLKATPGAGHTFVSWNGSGAGSYTGVKASWTLTVNGPITETATFAPIYPTPPAPASSTAGMPLALGLLVGLLVVGLVVGLLVGRMRRSGGGPSESQPPSAYGEGPGGPEEGNP